MNIHQAICQNGLMTASSIEQNVDLNNSVIKCLLQLLLTCFIVIVVDVALKSQWKAKKTIGRLRPSFNNAFDGKWKLNPFNYYLQIHPLLFHESFTHSLHGFEHIWLTYHHRPAIENAMGTKSKDLHNTWPSSNKLNELVLLFEAHSVICLWSLSANAEDVEKRQKNE